MAKPTKETVEAPKVSELLGKKCTLIRPPTSRLPPLAGTIRQVLTGETDTEISGFKGPGLLVEVGSIEVPAGTSMLCFVTWECFQKAWGLL